MSNPLNNQPYKNHVLAGGLLQDQVQSSHTLHQAYLIQPLAQRGQSQDDHARRDSSERERSTLSQNTSHFGDQEGSIDTNIIYSNFPSQTYQKGIRRRSRAIAKQPAMATGSFNPQISSLSNHNDSRASSSFHQSQNQSLQSFHDSFQGGAANQLSIQKQPNKLLGIKDNQRARQNVLTTFKQREKTRSLKAQY